MSVECPSCHGNEDLSKVRQPFQFTFGQLVFGLLGGAIGGLFWALGQENKYRCEKCQKSFFSHTPASRIFWILSVITYIVIAMVALYATVILFRH
jgi:hypothetical protein